MLVYHSHAEYLQIIEILVSVHTNTEAAWVITAVVYLIFFKLVDQLA